MKTHLRHLLALFLCLFHLHVFALSDGKIVSGKVLRVVDGDTVHLQDQNGLKHKIRLLGIDAPESQQAYGKQSAEWLTKQIGSHMIEAMLTGKDRYGRDIGTLLLNGKDLNLESVRQGNAWWYKQYAKQQTPEDQALYAQAEKEAQKRRLGLWSDKSPTPPWDWRKARRNGNN